VSTAVLPNTRAGRRPIVQQVNGSPDVDVGRFAERIRRSENDKSYRRLLDDLRAQPDGGVALVRALMKHSSNDARFWAAGVAREEYGTAAVPWLVEMAHDRRTLTRDIAMQELAAIDLDLLRPFVPEMRRILLRSKPPAALYGPGGTAMWRLVRLRDRESAAVFRVFANKQEHGPYYDHQMPMVLADYLDDPDSLVRRIKSHDHDSMLWLVMAAARLGVEGAEEALMAATTELPDDKCREICAGELRNDPNLPAVDSNHEAEDESPTR